MTGDRLEFGIAFIRPILNQCAEIDQRVAEGRHVPIKNRFRVIWIGRIELIVVGFQIVVHERNALRGGHAACQAIGDGIHQTVVIYGSHEIPALSPTDDLSCGEAFGLAKVGEAAGNGIKAVQFRHSINHCEADASANIFVVAHWLRNLAAHDHAYAALHYKEVGAAHVLVSAERIGARREPRVLPQFRQHLVFATHVVSAGGDHTKGRPAQHELLRAIAQQIGEVRGAVGELHDG